MGALLKSTWILLFAVVLVMLGHGLQGPLLGVRAIDEGFSTSVTGFIMSAYFTGLLFGSWVTPRLVRRVGHIRVFSALASIASICILAQAAIVEPATWLITRFLTGVCMSGLYVVVESWLNDRADNSNRGTLLAIYSSLQLVGVGGGQLLLNVSSPGGYDLFLLVSVLISLSLVPVALANISTPRVEQTEAVGLRQLYRISPFGIIGLFLLGIVQSALFGMSAVFASLMGMSVLEVSLFASAPYLGGVLLLFPVGYLSDRFDRRAVAVLVSLGAALFALFGFGLAGDFSWLLLVIALHGGLVHPLYSLLLAHANDNAKPEQMLSVCSGLVMVFGLGASIGPLSVGFAMDWIGPRAFFLFLFAVPVAIALFGIYRMTRRASVENQLGYMPMPLRATPVVASAVAKVVARRRRRQASEPSGPERPAES